MWGLRWANTPKTCIHVHLPRASRLKRAVAKWKKMVEETNNWEWVQNSTAYLILGKMQITNMNLQLDSSIWYVGSAVSKYPQNMYTCAFAKNFSSEKSINRIMKENVRRRKLSWYRSSLLQKRNTLLYMPQIPPWAQYLISISHLSYFYEKLIDFPMLFVKCMTALSSHYPHICHIFFIFF